MFICFVQHGRPRIKVKTSEEIAKQEREKELKKIEAFSQGLRAAMELVYIRNAPHRHDSNSFEMFRNTPNLHILVQF